MIKGDNDLQKIFVKLPYYCCMRHIKFKISKIYWQLQNFLQIYILQLHLYVLQ